MTAVRNGQDDGCIGCGAPVGASHGLYCPCGSGTVQLEHVDAAHGPNGLSRAPTAADGPPLQVEVIDPKEFYGAGEESSLANPPGPADSFAIPSMVEKAVEPMGEAASSDPLRAANISAIKKQILSWDRGRDIDLRFETLNHEIHRCERIWDTRNPQTGFSDETLLAHHLEPPEDGRLVLVRCEDGRWRTEEQIAEEKRRETPRSLVGADSKLDPRMGRP